MTDEPAEPDREEGQDTGPDVTDVLIDRRGRRMYSDADIAEALAHLRANGNNVLATAQALGIPESTLRAWNDGDRRARAVAELDPHLCEQVKQRLAQRAQGVAERMLTRLETADLEGVNVRDAAVVFGIAVDKMQILRGEASAIVESRNPEQEARADAIRSRYGRRLAPVQVTPHAPAPSSPDAGAPSPLSISPNSVGGAAAESPTEGIAPDAPPQ